ncbi:MAG: hypothetical protein LBW77_04125, partial [Verrucomicrobiota bacterium]|nr:hypothetical protein [Verrucomicrobiota bacterium]
MHTNKHECSITEHTELHGKSFVFPRVLCASVVKNWACPALVMRVFSAVGFGVHNWVVDWKW